MSYYLDEEEEEILSKIRGSNHWKRPGNTCEWKDEDLNEQVM